MSPEKKQSPRLYKIVVSHYFVSALCFLALTLMLFFSVKEMQGHYFQPRLLAITHMAALGWGTLIIFGACYQLIPVIFESDLSGYRLPWLSFILFIGGLCLLTHSFWVFQPGIAMQAGGLMLLTSVLLFAGVILQTAGSNKKKAGIHQEFIITSCIWLIATVVLGVLLVFNFRYAFLPKDHLLFLKLHAHMGIAGWFLLLIIGVSSKLIPMFLVSRKQNEGLLKWSYYLVNTALILFLADTYISGINIKTFIIAFVLISGIIMWFIYIVQCFGSRLKKHLDLPIVHTVLSFVLLTVSILVLPFIIHYHISGNPASINMTKLYGSLLFMGWISALILGQAFKTLPFIVWVKEYEHLAGKGKTPLPADLYKKGILKAQTITFTLFCLSFYTGLILKSDSLLCAGIVCLITTALLYIFNIITVLRHRSEITLYDKL
ncbi:hypothetical protein [Arcticibacter tournemirensis]